MSLRHHGQDFLLERQLNIARAEVGPINLAAWPGDGIISGILGLAFPASPSILLAPMALRARVPTSPVLSTMIADGQFAPLFGLTIPQHYSDTTTAGLMELDGILPQSLPQSTHRHPRQHTNAENNFLQTSPDQFQVHVAEEIW